MTAPSVVEDLGTVSAVSVARDRVPWALALAGLATTPLWASTPVWLACVAVVGTILFRVPWLPRRALGGWATAGLAAAGGLVGSVAWGNDDLQASWRGQGAALCVVALIWSVAVARSQRRGPDVQDAESAAGRLAVWAQDHPWTVAALCIVSIDPVTCFLLAVLQAASEALPRMDAATGLPWIFAGGLLVATSAAPRSILRAGEVLVVTMIVVQVAWTAAFHGLASGASGSGSGTTDMIDDVVRSAAFVAPVLVTLLVLRGRALGYRPVRGHVALVALAALDLAVSAVFASFLGDTMDAGDFPLAAHAVRAVVHAALLSEAAATVVPGRHLLVGAAVLGALTPIAIAVVRGDPSALHAAIPICLAGFARDVVCVLAARRLLSMTVVPRDHRLRTDWAVDLRAAGPRT